MTLRLAPMAKRSPSPSFPRKPKQVRPENEAFRVVFGTVALFTFLSLVTSLYLANQPELTEGGRQLLATTTVTWKLGFAAILGLIGGKTLP